MYALNNNVAYFDSFGVEHIPKEIKIIDKSIVVTNIFRIQAYDWVMCGYFCIGFMDFMLAGKNLTDFTNLFSSNNFKKNHDVISKYFMKYFKKRHNKIVMLARSKLNNIESKISETLINNEISDGYFMTIINEENKYRELKESIRIIISQRSDTEKINLIEEGKKIGIHEFI